MSSLFKGPKKRLFEKEQKNNETDYLSPFLHENLEFVKQKTGNSPDITIRAFKTGDASDTNLAIIYIDGIVDSAAVNEFIIETIMNLHLSHKLAPKEMLQLLTEEGVTFGSIQKIDKWGEFFSALMDGDTLILVEGTNQAITASTRGGEKRSIEEPTSQVAVRGPRDGFTESIQTNIALVRRRIRNPDLWTESMKIGKRSKTNVSIMYLKDVADDKVVDEVRRRLNKIQIDSILESGYIEQLIQDETGTTFPTLYHTERPDSVAGNILEGRVAIFVDGTPFVLVAPAVFNQFFQSVEDYYARFDIATALRFLRLLTFLLSIMAPAAYIAATTYHQEMIPTELLIIIAAQRESVPFPAFFEALIMEITFEILREAGVRMPRAVGSAISIVGALVIGQAAVQAGIVSPAMVIIVSITAIANFATPSFAVAISTRLIRFGFMALAAIFGLYGVILGMIFLIVHLCSLRSFGVPYMSPIAPSSFGNLGDTLIRVPLWVNRKRATLIMKGENIQGDEMAKPKPPIKRGMKKGIPKNGDNDEK